MHEPNSGYGPSDAMYETVAMSVEVVGAPPVFLQPHDAILPRDTTGFAINQVPVIKWETA